MELKIDKLKGVIPQKVLDELPSVIEKFSINTPLRLAHFLAQCHHESNGFTVAVENLNYSQSGLKKVFGKYFTDALLVTYARKPEKIANRVYANRMGNGSELSGDGWRHRGEGFLQITGKKNQQSFFKSIGLPIDTNPMLIGTKYPLSSAAWFFDNRQICNYCDRGAKDMDVEAVTKMVNGGLNGFEDRLAKFKKYWALLR